MLILLTPPHTHTPLLRSPPSPQCCCCLVGNIHRLCKIVVPTYNRPLLLLPSGKSDMLTTTWDSQSSCCKNPSPLRTVSWSSVIGSLCSPLRVALILKMRGGGESGGMSGLNAVVGILCGQARQWVAQHSLSRPLFPLVSLPYLLTSP